jgi:hypothetical protein
MTPCGPIDIDLFKYCIHLKGRKENFDHEDGYQTTWRHVLEDVIFIVTAERILIFRFYWDLLVLKPLPHRELNPVSLDIQLESRSYLVLFSEKSIMLYQVIRRHVIDENNVHLIPFFINDVFNSVNCSDFVKPHRFGNWFCILYQITRSLSVALVAICSLKPSTSGFCQGFHVEYPLLLLDLNENWFILTHFNTTL